MHMFLCLNLKYIKDHSVLYHHFDKTVYGFCYFWKNNKIAIEGRHLSFVNICSRKAYCVGLFKNIIYLIWVQ